MSHPRNFKFGFPYHVTSRANQKEMIFFEINDYRYFKKLLHKYLAIYEIPVFQYCIMPNHYHILLQCNSDTSIQKAMHRINCAYAFYLRKKYKWVGHVFQSRYHARVVGTIDYFLSVTEYIRRNPVKAGLAKSFDNYPWGYMDDQLVSKMTQVYRFMF